MTLNEDEVREELNTLNAKIERLTAALRAFTVHATYPVAKEINPRGYAWRGEEALDYAKELAESAFEQRGREMNDRPEIDASVRENRDMTDSERLSFGLDEMACNIRHWLKWTKDQRGKEGLDCGEYADVHFPVRPSYPQFVRWAETLEKAAEEMRQLREPVEFVTTTEPPFRCTVRGPQHIIVEPVK